jgi:hypothetical protein
MLRALLVCNRPAGLELQCPVELAPAVEAEEPVLERDPAPVHREVPV